MARAMSPACVGFVAAILSLTAFRRRTVNARKNRQPPSHSDREKRRQVRGHAKSLRLDSESIHASGLDWPGSGSTATDHD